MKRILTLLFFISTINLVFAQEKMSYQPDSLYKLNNVKVRKRFSGTNKKLSETHNYDNNGHLTKISYDLNMGASKHSTTIEYDNKGLIKSMIDSTKNGKPNKSEIKRLKKLGLNPQMFMSPTNKPPLEIARYDVLYNDNNLKKIIHYNSDGTLNYETLFSDKKDVKKLYSNGKVNRESTTVYLDEFHKSLYSGWQKTSSGNLSDWEYVFKYKKIGVRIISYTRYENNEAKETVKFEYYENGLLKIMKGKFTNEFYEYEYN